VKVNTVFYTMESVDNLRKTYFTEYIRVLCSIAFISTVMASSDHFVSVINHASCVENSKNRFTKETKRYYHIELVSISFI
jgi:hypothetical protein